MPASKRQAAAARLKRMGIEPGTGAGAGNTRDPKEPTSLQDRVNARLRRMGVRRTEDSTPPEAA